MFLNIIKIEQDPEDNWIIIIILIVYCIISPCGWKLML